MLRPALAALLIFALAQFAAAQQRSGLRPTPQPTPAPSGPNIMLWADGVKLPGASGDFKPFMEPYLLKDAPSSRGAVIVLPGGGYRNRSAREAGGVADRFNQAGMHAFVLQYHVAPSQHPAELLDVQRAVRMVRSRATEFGVNPDKIAVCGFSAGGHLAGSSGVFYDWKIEGSPDDLQAVSARPDALILCYPVINSKEFAHRGSFESLLGMDASVDQLEKMSLEKQVTEQTPPTFLWHTAADRTVPVQNSLLFAQALAEKGVPFELHVYPYGGHGMSLALNDPHVASWAPLACEWLMGMGWTGGTSAR